MNDFHRRVLIIEDNNDIASLLIDFFTDKGHLADYASNGKQGLDLVTINEYDVILLDLALPGIDGIDLCNTLRRELNTTTPILMLTARDSIEEKLIGFDAGADDYLVKPFDLLEVYARVQALWRRSLSSHVTLLKVADLSLNFETLEVQRANKTLKLNSIRIKILRLLMENTHRIVSRREIESSIWGDEVTESDALRTHLSAIRQCIDKPFEKKLLHTIHSVGYRLFDDQIIDD